jgi:hypothetical protein
MQEGNNVHTETYAELYEDLLKYIDEVTAPIDEDLFFKIINTSSGMGIVEIKTNLERDHIPNSQAYIVRILEIANIMDSGKFGKFIEANDGPGANKFSPALFKAMAKAPFYYRLDKNDKIEFYGFDHDELLQHAEAFEEF